ncbi:MAG: hypothetical protein KAS32_21565, partial [Candidatus Peribacteraceae bacterium]|nr:hypothetical protein [Candidatus Peribacteraceae bacterium]
MDPAVIVESLSGKGVTPEWILENLIEIAENSDKDSTRMTAIKEIRKIINETAERAGIITKVTQTQTMEDGSVLTAERVANVLAGNTARSAHQVDSTIINPIIEGTKDGKERKESEEQTSTPEDPACSGQKDGQVRNESPTGIRNTPGRDEASASG